MILLASLIHGDDCLDDIEAEFGQNPSAEAYFGGSIPVAKTFGDYLRDFDESHLEALSKFVTRMGFSIREHLQAHLPVEHRPSKIPCFSVDSTFHDQAGSKIEGCAFNYEGRWGLSSEVVYDDKGIAYAGELLAGNAKPGVFGPKLLEQVLTPLRNKKIKSPFQKVAIVTGDSAYGYEEFIRVCQSNHASFVIAARAHIPWQEQANIAQDWTEWKYSNADFLRWQKKKRNPPARFLSRFYWSPSWAPHLKPRYADKLSKFLVSC